MKIKSLVRGALEGAINFAGYDVEFAKKGVRELTAVDKMVWEPFCRRIDRVELYQKAMDITDMRDTDNFPRQLRFDSLQQSIQHILKNNVEGDFAECGCWKGLSAYITCHYISEFGGNRQFLIFDSFEGGLSDKNEKDENLRYQLSDQEILEEKLHFSSTEAHIHKALEHHDNYRLYKGWIPERFSEVSGTRFAFVNIDVDLYQPTKDSVEFFFPRLSSGGIIVCDDYNMSQFPGAKAAIDEFANSNQDRIRYFYEVPMGGCLIIKR
ncbi:MAG: TylF/MycF/NovP-related O-methyltransferase [bacterium]